MNQYVLFLQTTDGFRYQFGLINNPMARVDIVDIDDIKSSANIFSQLHDFLTSKKLTLKEDIKEILICSGPGSYTGMRVGEGIASILELLGIKVCNYYQYDIPKHLGHKSGSWICKAFKGEYFIHEWTVSGSAQNLLLNEQKLMEYIESTEHELFNLGVLPETIKQLRKISAMDGIISQQPELLLTISKCALRLPLLYFRAPEIEFKVSI